MKQRPLGNTGYRVSEIGFGAWGIGGAMWRGVDDNEGRKALRIDRSYASMDQPQDWLGYDFLKADLDSQATRPMNLTVEIRDAGTRDYWTRVNYETVVPPGRSTLIVPVKQLYVGEKSKPGRKLILDKITRLVFFIGDTPAAPAVRGALTPKEMNYEIDFIRTFRVARRIRGSRSRL